MDVAQRQTKMEVVVVPKDMDHAERETLEEVMLQFVIEASLNNTCCANSDLEKLVSQKWQKIILVVIKFD